MNFGHFEDDGTRYVISTAKTPTPWRNQLLNREYYLETSQRLCGASFAVENYRRYPVLAEEKYFYVKCGGQVHHLCCGKGLTFCCEHHLYKTVVREEFSGFSSTVTVFVPAEGQREIWNIEIENRSGDQSDYEVFACFEFGNIVYQSLACKYKNGCFCKTSFPYFFKYDEYEKLKDDVRVAYAMSSNEPASVECSKRRFWGGDDPYTLPSMVLQGGSNQKSDYETCVAAFHHRIKIGAGERKAITYAVGVEKTEKDVFERKAAFPYFRQELEIAKRAMMEQLKPLQIHTQYEDLNVFVNYWAKRQTLYLATHNRGSLVCPVRNQLQDAMGYAVIAPEKAWKSIQPILRRQKWNGYLKQWYAVDGSAGAGLCQLDHSDACVWLILCTIEVIRLCKDDGLYFVKASYSDCEIEETILAHLEKAAFYMARQTGSHGLCLMKDGDWTDPINGPGRFGRGESTWNTMALIYAIALLREVHENDELCAIQKQLTNSVNCFCWNEDRYIVGFDDDGAPVGCKTDDEGSLFLNTQTWAIISGICSQEREKILWNTIEILNTDAGYRLLYPPFSQWNPQWGKISIKHKGNTENGSIYSHGNMFMAYADFLSGRNEKAIETIRKILPTNPQNGPSNNLQVPLFIPNYYVGNDGCDFGRSSNIHLSGAPAWLLWLANKYLKE